MPTLNMTKKEIIEWLSGADDATLFERSAAVRDAVVGDSVYLRGLIEVSNVCRKDCLYCGIRKSNLSVDRYELTTEQVLDAVAVAVEQKFGSVVLQSGEQTSAMFIDFIENIVREITVKYDGVVGITLSLGEQTESTFARWKNAGAHRYLLRMESSSADLYSKIHPSGYSLRQRLRSIETLQRLNYQVGSGVMIGLPFQTIDHLADDLLAMVRLDIDMCGMGPYVEHNQTPLAELCRSAFSPAERVLLTLRMVALLRMMMPDINIAATTATETLDPLGRAKSVAVGANVIMPNITPSVFRDKYCLYEGKTSADLDLKGYNIAYSCRGDSKRSRSR